MQYSYLYSYSSEYEYLVSVQYSYQVPRLRVTTVLYGFAKQVRGLSVNCLGTAFFWYTFYTALRENKTGYLEHFFSNCQKLFLGTECMSPGCQVQPNKIYFSTKTGTVQVFLPHQNTPLLCWKGNNNFNSNSSSTPTMYSNFKQ